MIGLSVSLYASAKVRDASAVAYFAAMTTAPSSTEMDLVDALVVGMKSAGIWDALSSGGGGLLLLPAETEQAARVNLFRPSQVITAVNSPTFTANLGWSGNGTSSHLDTGQTLATWGITQNSVTQIAFCNQASATTGTKPHWSTSSITQVNSIVPNSSGNGTFRVGSTTASTATGDSGRLGRRIAIRNDSTAQSLYKNGALVVNGSVASTGVMTGNLMVLRNNSVYTDDRISVFGAGPGITGTQAIALDGLLLTYLTAKSAN